ncbi:MAG: cobalamin-binding protein [Bacteroidetes bacterium]|nr:MAG: cobalamin-binding protein [Bacteroidota bacterium]
MHPETLKQSRTVVGGTKTLHMDKIAALNPDIIIANKEENDEGLIKELMSKYQVWTSDIHNLDDSLEMISALGKICDREDNARKIMTEIKRAFQKLEIASLKSDLTAAYFIWRDPYMAVGGHSFISHMLEHCGLKNIFQDSVVDYPKYSAEELHYYSPDLVLLSSEPFPFKEKHVSEFQNLFPHSKIILVDGELFSWYGSRLQKSPAYFRQLFEDN